MTATAIKVCVYNSAGEKEEELYYETPTDFASDIPSLIRLYSHMSNHSYQIMGVSANHPELVEQRRRLGQ